MKYRTDFVTNSSSTSWICYGFFSDKLLEYVEKLVREGHIYNHSLLTNDPMDPGTLRGFLVHGEYETKHKINDDLVFLRDNHDRDKIRGFRIAIEDGTLPWGIDVGRNDLYSLLRLFFDLKELPEDEAGKIEDDLRALVEKAEKDGVVVKRNASGLSDSFVPIATDTLKYTDRIKDKLQPKNDKIIERYPDREAESVSILKFGAMIDDSAFEGMTNLKNVEMSNVKSIGKNAFSGCVSLADVIIGIQNKNKIDPDLSAVAYIETTKPEDPGSVIGENAFKDCSSIKHVILRTNTVDKGAFQGCEALESVRFDRVRTVKAKAFADCKALKDVCFDKVVSSIAKNAFSGSKNIVIHAPYCSFAEEFAIDNGISFINYPDFSEEAEKWMGKNSSILADAASLDIRGRKVYVEVLEGYQPDYDADYMKSFLKNAGADVSKAMNHKDGITKDTDIVVLDMHPRNWKDNAEIKDKIIKKVNRLNKNGASIKVVTDTDIISMLRSK